MTDCIMKWLDYVEHRCLRRMSWNPPKFFWMGRATKITISFSVSGLMTVIHRKGVCPIFTTVILTIQWCLDVLFFFIYTIYFVYYLLQRMLFQPSVYLRGWATINSPGWVFFFPMCGFHGFYLKSLVYKKWLMGEVPLGLDKKRKKRKRFPVVSSFGTDLREIKWLTVQLYEVWTNFSIWTTAKTVLRHPAPHKDEFLI